MPEPQHVLIVDDHARMVAMLERWLKRAGFHVTGVTTIQNCSNGQQTTSPAGTRGCCTSTPTSAMTIQLSCSGANEDAHIFVRIDQPTTNTCTPYKLDYHY